MSDDSKKTKDEPVKDQDDPKIVEPPKTVEPSETVETSEQPVKPQTPPEPAEPKPQPPSSPPKSKKKTPKPKAISNRRRGKVTTLADMIDKAVEAAEAVDTSELCHVQGRKMLKIVSDLKMVAAIQRTNESS
jgi:outer membrane biosynthesis protein TonB